MFEISDKAKPFDYHARAQMTSIYIHIQIAIEDIRIIGIGCIADSYIALILIIT